MTCPTCKGEGSIPVDKDLRLLAREVKKLLGMREAYDFVVEVLEANDTHEAAYKVKAVLNENWDKLVRTGKPARRARR